jgi:CBS domain-containing protein
MKTADIMSTEPVAVRWEDFVTRARQIMRENLLHSMPVVDEKKRVVGIITSGDIMRVTSTKSNVTVKGFVVSSPTVNPDTSIQDAAKALVKSGVGRIPVVDNSERLVGSVSMKEVFRVLDFSRMHSIPVSSVMSRKVKTSSPDEDVSTLWMNMVESGFTGYPAVEKGKVVGIITRKDLLNSGAARMGREGRKAKSGTQVGKIMSKSVISVSEDDDIKMLIDLFRSEQIGRVPVLKNKKMVGIVDRHDIVNAYLKG